MLNSKRMARTLTAPEALSWYFKRRPAFVKDICWHVTIADNNTGTRRTRHAKEALAEIAEPARVNTFLLQHADALALVATTRQALENDAAEMRTFTERMKSYLADPWLPHFSS
ncbi:MAG: hypothetical protein IJ985_01205 [Akkermansia sp.]|nr:hypothetical protein [Akkermansia sp.]